MKREGRMFWRENFERFWREKKGGGFYLRWVVFFRAVYLCLKYTTRCVVC